MTTTLASSRRTELVLTVLRVVAGLIMVAHGVQKLAAPAETAQAFAGIGLPLPQLMVALAILGEFVGGLGLALGALTHIAALGPLCVLAVAVISVHLDKGLFAESGGFEYPLVLLLVALVFVVHGGGPYSLDAWVKKHRSPRSGDEPVRRAPHDGELRGAV